MYLHQTKKSNKEVKLAVCDEHATGETLGRGGRNVRIAY
jgi:hypothetical protein